MKNHLYINIFSLSLWGSLAFSVIFSPFLSFSQGSGNTLTFNGTNQFVDIGNQVANGCRTIELWFKPGVNIVSTLNSPKTLLHRDFNNGSGQSTDEFGLYFAPSSWQGGVNAGKVVFIRCIGSSVIQIASDNNFWEADHWYHVCATIDPVSGMKLYINGILQQENHPSTNSIGTQNSTQWDKVSIGRWGNLNIRYFNGEIDEVRFWETERSQQQIRDKMCSSLLGNEFGLRAYWNFNSGTGLALIDNSTNSYNGTLQFMNNSNWVYSGAPIGNVSTHSYPGSLMGTSTTLNTGLGDEFTVDNFNSTAQGVQLYKVNSLPNVTTGLSSPTTNNYYGVFLTSTNGTYDVNYDYNAYGCSSCDEIYSRNDNAVLNWLQITNGPQNCAFNLTNESSTGYDYRAEYIINTSTGGNFLGNDTTLCQGANLLLEPQIINSTFLWQDNSTSSTYTVTQPGIYWVEVTNSCGFFLDSIVVDFINPPSFNLGNDTVLCQSSSIILDPGLTSVTYNWQDNSTASSYTVNLPGIYWVEVTNSCGVFIDSISVDFINPPSFNLGNDTVLCQSAGLFLAPGLTGSTYVWQNNSTTPTYTVTQPGIYWVEVTNSCGGFIDSIVVDFVNPPSLNLGNDTVLCQSSSIILAPGLTSVTYNWQDNSTASSYTVNLPGIYWVEVTNSCGVFIDSISVDFINPPSFNLGNDTVLCQSAGLFLAPELTGSTYVWQNNSTTPTYTVTQPGIYWVEVTNSCGVLIDSIVVDFVNPPSLNLGNDTILCQTASIILDPGLTSVTYNWQDNSTNSTFLVTQTGTYFLDISNICGSDSDTIEIQIGSVPIIDLGADTILCEGESLILNATTAFLLYEWQDGSVNSSFDVTQSGIYWVEVTNACGSDSDTVEINVIALPNFNLGVDTTICEGTTIQLQSPSISGNITWQDGSISSLYTVSQSGLYSGMVLINGCMVSDTIFVDVVPLPIVELGADTLICEGDNIILTSNVTGSYEWSTGSSESNLMVSTFGEYALTITNECGTATDTINIEDLDCSCAYYIPNTFTPDGEGLNDEFGVIYDCDIYNFDLKIYDRWGELIYTSFNPDSFWDGTYKGVLVQIGTYTYQVNFETGQGNLKTIIGHVNVLY